MMGTYKCPYETQDCALEWLDFEGCGIRQVGGPGSRIPRRNLVIVQPNLTFRRVTFEQAFMCPSRVGISPIHLE
jgi:hypothetical protein